MKENRFKSKRLITKVGVTTDILPERAERGEVGGYLIMGIRSKNAPNWVPL